MNSKALHAFVIVFLEIGVKLASSSNVSIYLFHGNVAMDTTMADSEDSSTSTYLINISHVLNVSNMPLHFNSDIIMSTTELAPVMTVAESLQTTRFVVQSVLTPVIVTIGLLGNFLNILVLLQPSMRTSTNVYILVLSIADSVFLAFNFALSFLDCRKKGLSYTAYHFNPYGRFMSNFSGNAGVWVTVVFTVERYIAICHPMYGKVWCTVHRAKLASMTVGVLTLVSTIPTMFELEVVNIATGPVCRPTQFAANLSYEIGYSWWYVTAFTFIPLTCLTIFNVLLIRALLVASQQRQQLVLSSTTSSRHHEFNGTIKESKCFQNTTLSSNLSSTYRIPDDASSSNSTSGSVSVQRKHRQSKRFSREQNKVTLMLITIVMIFLLCQLPWTALYLYQTCFSISDTTTNRSALKIAGNICNMLQLVNASVNFYLYSCFSKRFRQTLANLMMFWRGWNLSPTSA